MRKNKLLLLLAMLMTAATGAWAEETPLVTITFDSNGPVYSVEGLVTLTGTDYKTGSAGGQYYWYPSDFNTTFSATVAAAADNVSITKVVFWSPDNGNYANPLEDTAAPYVCYANASMSKNGKSLSDDFATKVEGYRIAKVEVYGAAPAGPTTYKVTMKDGVKDADKWTITPNEGLKEGDAVTLTYSGRLKVKGVKATSDAAPAEEPVTQATPLTIEALTAGTVTVNMNGELSTGMKYSVNGGTKTTIYNTTNITVAKGDKVQFYGNGTSTQAYGNTPEVSIQGSGDGFQTKVYGNIMSLLDEEGFATKTDLPNAEYVFYQLFKGNTTLNDASELLLPAATLAADCYNSMFFGCTNLTTAPKLPATTLAASCYIGMFYGCTSLTTAYVKAAYTQANDECATMFNGCTATGAVLHTTSGSKANWETKMGTGKTWSNWTVADDWQE